jgi:hypothetical protein
LLSSLKVCQALGTQLDGHVPSFPTNSTNIEVIGKNKLIPISGSVIKSPLPPSGKRTDDRFDMAVVPLADDIAVELSHFTFLDIGRVDPSDRPFKQSLYTFTGYPVGIEDVGGADQKVVGIDLQEHAAAEAVSCPMSIGRVQRDDIPGGAVFGVHDSLVECVVCWRERWEPLFDH